MRVAILGCGYVGIELGRRLRSEHDVVGVRRSEDGLAAVGEAGLRPVRADLTDADALSAVPDADVVVFAASAGGRDAGSARETYVAAQRTVVGHFSGRASPPERYLYTSSTGVYGDHDGAWVDESTPLDPGSERARTLVEGERLALEATAEAGIDGTVARLGGLYGPERYRLQRYLDGPVTEGYLNLTHRADAAGALAYLIEEDQARGEVVLVVDDEPVSRWDLADYLAAESGEPAPPKQTLEDRLEGVEPSSGRARRIAAQKRCDNAKLRHLGYDLEVPTFREGYRPAIERFRADGR